MKFDMHAILTIQLAKQDSWKKKKLQKSQFLQKILAWHSLRICLNEIALFLQRTIKFRWPPDGRIPLYKMLNLVSSCISLANVIFFFWINRIPLFSKYNKFAYIFHFFYLKIEFETHFNYGHPLPNNLFH